MGNQYLGLSLFIMLLSFFIVLNALSDFKDIKADPVISSLSMAFSANPVGEREHQSIQQAESTNDTGKGDALDRIQGVFNAQFENFRAQRNRLGTEMFLFVPTKDFDDMMKRVAGETLEDTAETQFKTTGLYNDPVIAKVDDFVPTMASLMRSEDGGVPYRMDMILKQEVNDQTTLRDLVSRVTRWAGVMEDAGLPQKYLSAGIEALDEKSAGQNGVYLHFRRYEPVILTAATTTEGVLPTVESESGQ